MWEEHLDLVSDGGGILQGRVSKIGIASRQLWANFAIGMGGRDGFQKGFQGVESNISLRCDIRGDDRSPDGRIPAVFLRNWQMIRVHGREMVSTRTPRLRS